jgi:hypothetical protein
MTGNIRTPSLRAPNAVAKHTSKRKVSADGTRWAIGRSQKRHLANHTWDIVECWTLKQRVRGRVSTISTHQSEEAAIAFVNKEGAQ